MDAYRLTIRQPIVSKWGSERYDVWEGDRVVGALWDWRPGWAADQRWTVEATTRYGIPLGSSRGVVMTSQLEARAWLVRWWIDRRSGKSVGL